jgi:hypothetical protein
VPIPGAATTEKHSFFKSPDGTRADGTRSVPATYCRRTADGRTAHGVCLLPIVSGRTADGRTAHGVCLLPIVSGRLTGGRHTECACYLFASTAVNGIAALDSGTLSERKTSADWLVQSPDPYPHPRPRSIPHPKSLSNPAPKIPIQSRTPNPLTSRTPNPLTSRTQNPYPIPHPKSLSNPAPKIPIQSRTQNPYPIPHPKSLSNPAPKYRSTPAHQIPTQSRSPNPDPHPHTKYRSMPAVHTRDRDQGAGKRRRFAPPAAARDPRATASNDRDKHSGTNSPAKALMDKHSRTRNATRCQGLAALLFRCKRL